MIKSKSWNWNIVKGDHEEFWKNPSEESYYLVNRWLSQNKNMFLDLGCGLGRHCILFAKNGFKTFAFDLSEDAIKKTKEWMKTENLETTYDIGDMLELPYPINSMECVLCRNVISHTDTEGIKLIIKELFRVLKSDGECYLTLGSKQSEGFKQDWPVVDENTKIRIEDGPENGIPHFYADYDLIKELFKDFKIINISQIENFHNDISSWHYHILIKK
jgi:2-polyprenyl-3-methyl-5-hydroxy-6-metoxy-1,4-benzoquinol methylase